MQPGPGQSTVSLSAPDVSSVRQWQTNLAPHAVVNSAGSASGGVTSALPKADTATGPTIATPPGTG